MHATGRIERHNCMGSIVSGGTGEIAHRHCDRCGAFQYDDAAGPFPTGIDKAANQAAWDAGESRSPDAFAVEVDDMVSAGRIAQDYDYGRVLSVNRERGWALIGWEVSQQAIEVPIATLRPVDAAELAEARAAWAAEREA